LAEFIVRPAQITLVALNPSPAAKISCLAFLPLRTADTLLKSRALIFVPVSGAVCSAMKRCFSCIAGN